MARTFYHSDVNSDLSGGADYDESLVDATGTSSPRSVGVANGATETSFLYTGTGVPGTGGATGDYTVRVNVTTANANILLSTQLRRINSSGVVQTSSSASAEQSLGSTGVKTFTFNAQSLGTWAAGDRLRVDHIYRCTATHGTNTVSIDRLTASTATDTPFAGTTIERNIGQVTETDTAQDNGLAVHLYAIPSDVETDEAQPHGRRKDYSMGLAW